MARVTEAQWARRPPGLRRALREGVWYYAYRDPVSRKEKGLGTDFERASRAVMFVNTQRAPKAPDLVARLRTPTAPWGKHLTWFDENVLQKWRHRRSGKPMSEESLYIRQLYLKKLREHFGELEETSRIDRRACASFLELQTPQQHNRYRQFMALVFKHAVARGLRDDNPMELTMAVQFNKERQRLTKAAFDKIHEHAAPWLQRAMDLALWSLQRREDMATWTAPENWRDGRLYVRQGKVEGHGTGLLTITPGPKLLAAIVACLNSPERGDCPYLVAAVPRKKGRKAAWRTHPRQVGVDMLTREFKAVADKQKVFEGMTEDQKPTWHEIRALGGDLYCTELGWADEQVQALMGHTTLKMTRQYLDGHGERWAEVRAG